MFPHVSPYNYAENRPIDGIDLWGLQYMSMNAVNLDATRARMGKTDGFTGDQYIKASMKGTATGFAIGSIFTPGPEDIVMGAAAATKAGKAIMKFGDDIVKGAKNLFSKGDDVADATKNRVKLRKNVVEQVKENAQTTPDGDFIDPNTGDIIPKDGPYDIGHKPGQEWKKRKKRHQDKGSTRKQVIEEENNPDLYQIEDPSSNRSRKHEKKD